ncbi:MAG: hypothetical protein RBU21_24130, partial [FCB group bacterium]|nr:hypothetical protein [FCB group bacterium]
MINDNRRAVLCGLLVFLFSSLGAFPAVAQDPNPPSIYSDRGAWPIRRQWNMAEMKHFSKWVQHIYTMKTTGTVEQRIAKIETVLSDPQMNLLLDPSFAGADCNPQIDRSIMRMMHASLDCAKFTQAMPAYYSYRRALPWIASYVTSSEGDVRMTPYSIPVGTMNSFTHPSLYGFFTDLTIGFSSGNYRVQPFQ